MRAVVSVTLLLFELLMISAHVLPASEQENGPRDIYEVQEAGNQKTTFFAPKPDKPTLREIVYYHVIERPYGEIKLERQSEPLQIEMEASMRPFTNGHGYQFADNDIHETESHDSPTIDSDYANEEEDEKPLEEKSEMDTEEQAAEPEKSSDVTTEKSVLKDKLEFTTKMNKEMSNTTPSENKKIKQRQFLFDRLRERYSASFKKNATTQKPENAISTEPSAISSSTEKDAILNSTLKVETSTSTSPTTSSTAERVKRSANYEEIPIAPTLPSIDYSKYSGIDVFREPASDTAENTEESNPDSLKAMKFKMDDIFATMKPYDDDTATHTPEVKVKTFGMNLSDDQGTVWNNMWRPMNYHVGKPMKLYEVNEYKVSTVTPVTEEITTEATTDPKDFEDILVDAKKDSTSKKDIEAMPIHVDIKDRKDRRKPTTEKPDTKMDETTEKNDVKKENVASRTLIHKNPLRKEKPTQDTKPDLYEQLIKSDKFWKWLAHWTSHYVEILSEHVKNMVKEEVAKEMKKIDKGHAYSNKTKEENKPSNPDIAKNKEPVIKNNTLIIDGKEIPITNNSNLEGNITKDFLKKHKDRHEKPNVNKLNETKFENNKTISNKLSSNATKSEENYNNVKAHNIYGSATGNDQVTNVFIFYPGTEAEKIIYSLKPIFGNNISEISTNNNDKNDKDNKKEDKATEKPIESAIKDPDNITPKPIKDDKTNKTEEKLAVDNKNTTKLEANKENESTPSKEGKGSVTEKNATDKVAISSTTETTKTTESPRISTVTTTEKSDSSISTVVTTEKSDSSISTVTTTEKSDSSISTIVATEKSEPSTTKVLTDKSTEKSSDTTTTSSTDASRENPTSTTTDSTESSTENSIHSSTLDPVNTTTLASTEATTNNPS